MNKPVKIFSSVPLMFVSFFRKSKVDNFVFGLIFGSIFSLIVNIYTVKVQEDLTKQRVLESLEREITLHLLEISSVLSSEKTIHSTTFKDMSSYNLDNIMSQRLDTRVWESGEMTKYFFEIDPNSAAEIESYYIVMVDSVNRTLERNQKDFESLFKPCRAFYSIIDSKKPETPEYCSTIAKESVKLQAYTLLGVMETINKVKTNFHPTKDRLNNWWLRLLLGDKSIEILR